MEKCSVNIMNSCETQMKLSLSKENEKFKNFFHKVQDRRYIVGCNKTKPDTQNQMGGTATLLGPTKMGLGGWC